MNTRDNDPLHAAINEKLSANVAASLSKPARHDDWMQLGPETPETERLLVYQAIRAAGDLPDDAGFYQVFRQVDAMSHLFTEGTMRELSSPAPEGR